MGLYKTIGLKYRAEKIASRFLMIRQQHFDGMMQLVEERFSLPILHRTLGGDADLALKGYQLWISTLFNIEHPYVVDSERQEFIGHLTLAVSGAERERVQWYFNNFYECRKDVDQQIVRLATPVSDYIVGSLSDYSDDIEEQDGDPPPVFDHARNVTCSPMFALVGAEAMIASLLPFFEYKTKMVLAEGNVAVLRELQEEMEAYEKTI
jgi:hypothetical protein